MSQKLGAGGPVDMSWGLLMLCTRQCMHNEFSLAQEACSFLAGIFLSSVYMKVS